MEWQRPLKSTSRPEADNAPSAKFMRLKAEVETLNLAEQWKDLCDE